MAISGVFLQLIEQCIGILRQEDANKKIDLLELSYPDLLSSAEEIDLVFGQGMSERLSVRPDGEKIKTWHNCGHLPCIYETHGLWENLGISTTTIDIVVNRGDEIIVDLNFPLKEDLVEKFDFVIDPGTLEHCFNVGQAFVNICSSLRQGGLVLQVSPLNIYNHGFWSFNPTIYGDFCEDNGFDLIWMKAMAGDETLHDVELFSRFNDAPYAATLITAYQRREVKPIVFPMQRKYR